VPWRNDRESFPTKAFINVDFPTFDFVYLQNLLYVFNILFILQR
jgi:hypothetical protein